MVGLSQIVGAGVSSYNPPVPLPTGNADTITNALGPWDGVVAAGHSQGAHDLVYKAASTGFFTYDEPSCSGAGISGGPSIGAQIGASAAGTALDAIPVVGSTLSKIFSALNPVAHHAAAVRTEQATLCEAVPNANNFLRGIDSAVAMRQIDVATAAQALEQGYMQWLLEVKPILQNTGGKCNAACVYAKAFRAAIEKRKQDYAIIAAQNAAGAQGVVGGVVNALTGAASSFASAFLPSSSPAVLGQAGLTAPRQSMLATFLLIGGVLVGVAVFARLFSGGGK